MIPFAAPLAAFAAKEGVKRAVGIAKWAVPLLALVGIAIYIFMLKADVRSLAKQRDNLQVWKTNMVQVVTAEAPAERRKSVDGNTAADEVRWLGREYRTHRDALERQSAALRVAAGHAVAAQKDAAEARKQAKERRKGDDSTRRGLNDPKRATGLTEAEWGKL